MPVIDTNIQNEVLSLIHQLNQTDVTDKDKAMKDFADGVGTIIANAIRSGTVVITAVPVVVTVGGVPGAGTATGTATIT